MEHDAPDGGSTHGDGMPSPVGSAGPVGAHEAAVADPLPVADRSADEHATAPDGERRGKRLRVGRRTVLIAGGGLAVGGAALAAAHVPSRLAGGIRALHLPTTAPRPLVVQWPDGPTATPHDLIAHDGALADGWQDWSWGDHTLDARDRLHEDRPAIRMRAASWAGLKLLHDLFDADGFGYVQCWVRTGAAAVVPAKIYLSDSTGQWHGGATLAACTREGALSPDEWRLARLPLGAFGGERMRATGIVIQAATAGDAGTLYLADLRLVFQPAAYPARVESAVAHDTRTITVVFARQMSAATAGMAGNYLIAAERPGDAAYPANTTAPATDAHLHAESPAVSLSVPRPLTPGAGYVVSLANLRDRFDQPITGATVARVTVAATPSAITGDVGADRRPISPDIYGVAAQDVAVSRQMGARLWRWGGNSVTRYNWKVGNAFNSARDWHFQNGSYGNDTDADRAPSGVADVGVAAVLGAGMGMLLTIPAIGWVARAADGAASTGVPNAGGPPTRPFGDAIAGYDPAANRARTSVPSRARKGAPFADPPDHSDPTVAQDEWVHHLTRRFGDAAHGGVRYYAIDNEPDLWPTTHTDIRPAQLGYEQMRDVFLDYATAVKDVDPTAQVVGPVMWHPYSFTYSPLDYGADNFRTHADYRAHGGVPFLEWWLREIRAHDERTGRRTLDVLDLHIYPQGNVYSDDVSPAMQALRLRSTRQLWDPTYVEETWIAQKLQFVRRMRDVVARCYPGTRIGLSEYNWGAMGHISGAIALADVLGIFGREGLDMACLWGGPAPDQPAFAAFRLFGNYDGRGSGVLGTSFRVAAEPADILSAYGADTGDGAALMVVLNKRPGEDVTPTVRLRGAGRALGGARPGRVRVWRLSSDAAGLVTMPDLVPSADGDDAVLTTTFPAYSVTLLRFEAAR